MLEELLKHDKLGNREELLFFLFEGISAKNSQALPSLRKYCISNVFSISRCFDGILKLFQFISFIEIVDDKVRLNKKCFDQVKFDRLTYFNQFHFYEHLISTLERTGILYEMFNEKNLKFSPRLSQYYVLDNKFPYKYFTFRNMLISTGFFHLNKDLVNHLIIK